MGKNVINRKRGVYKGLDIWYNGPLIIGVNYE